MAKRSTSAEDRRSPTAKLRPAKKTTRPKTASKVRIVAEPEPLPDPLDEALAETFPGSDPVAIGLSDRIGEPAQPEQRGVVERILRLLWLGKR
jgi:hypothetical protein